MKTKWHYSGDVNMLDYGGKNFRHTSKRQFQIVELINMDEACGRDNLRQPKYVVDLKLVDLDAIPPEEQRKAMDCCGYEVKPDSNGFDVYPDDLMLAEMCDSYGCHAPLGSWRGNNARNLMRQAYREANDLLDADALEETLERSVNAIGSTAREFMAGNITSAIQRGVESGRPDARIMAKIHGVPQEVIDNTRPDDWLPYVMGYMRAMAGMEKETDPDYVPEYHRGYDRGLQVKAGNCPAPDWIQHHSPNTATIQQG